MKGDCPSVPVPSHGTTGSEGGVVDGRVVLGQIREARGNLESLRGKVQVQIVAGEKVLEAKRRLREARRAVEELEGTLVSMGTGDGGLKVEEGRGGIVELGVGVEGHLEENPMVPKEPGGGGVAV